MTAAVLLAVGGWWWLANAPVRPEPFPGIAVVPATAQADPAPGTLADRLPRLSPTLIREVKPLTAGSVFSYVLPDGGGGYLVQFVCDGEGALFITNTDSDGVSDTSALDCSEASAVQTLRFTGPSAVRIGAYRRADGLIAVQIVRLS
jgi:hypothetical protein